MKIFFKDKLITINAAGPIGTPVDGTLYIKYDGPGSLSTSFSELEKDPAVTHLIIGSNDLNAAFSEFQKMFRVIEAAGGLVQNNKGEYLFIFRKGKWDLPKGKLDKGESTRNAALREVHEECGVTGLSITKELSTTYHIYEEKGQKIIKHTYWYAMLCADGGQLVPQTEEDITEVRWMDKEQVNAAMRNTYPAIKQLAEGLWK